MDDWQKPFEALLGRISPDFVIHDMTQYWAPRLAAELSIPTIFFVCSPAAGAGFLLGHEAAIVEKGTLVPDVTVPPPGFPTAHIHFSPFEARKNLHVHQKKEGNISLAERWSMCSQGSWVIIVNTCVELEGKYLDYLQRTTRRPVLPVGMLMPYLPPPPAADRCLAWLDLQQPRSVVVVSFGSECILTTQELAALAVGLEESELPFLFVFLHHMAAALPQRFVGSIPGLFGDSLVSLQFLSLANNNLLGPIPKSFSSSNIKTLWLNNQVGSKPIDVVAGVSMLEQLWLQSNEFTGPIPDLTKLTSLQDLRLRDNKLTGVVPSSLSSLLSLRNTSLINNALQGPYPSFPNTVEAEVGGDTENSFCLPTPAKCDDRVSVLLEFANGVGYLFVLLHHMAAALPQGFVERTQGRGLLVTEWAPQLHFLSHSSAGAFLTHCGWNSVTEGLRSRVPFVTLPMHHEQGLNAKLIARELKLGVEVWRNEEDDSFSKEDVSKAVRYPTDGVLQATQEQSLRKNLMTNPVSPYPQASEPKKERVRPRNCLPHSKIFKSVNRSR